MTNRRVAETVFLSPRTINRYPNAATRKLGVTSLTALLMTIASPATRRSTDTDLEADLSIG